MIESSLLKPFRPMRPFVRAPSFHNRPIQQSLAQMSYPVRNESLERFTSLPPVYDSPMSHEPAHIQSYPVHSPYPAQTQPDQNENLIQLQKHLQNLIINFLQSTTTAAPPIYSPNHIYSNKHPIIPSTPSYSKNAHYTNSPNVYVRHLPNNIHSPTIFWQSPTSVQQVNTQTSFFEPQPPALTIARNRPHSTSNYNSQSTNANFGAGNEKTLRDLKLQIPANIPETEIPAEFGRQLLKHLLSLESMGDPDSEHSETTTTPPATESTVSVQHSMMLSHVPLTNMFVSHIPSSSQYHQATPINSLKINNQGKQLFFNPMNIGTVQSMPAETSLYPPYLLQNSIENQKQLSLSPFISLANSESSQSNHTNSADQSVFYLEPLKRRFGLSNEKAINISLEDALHCNKLKRNCKKKEKKL